MSSITKVDIDSKVLKWVNESDFLSQGLYDDWVRLKEGYLTEDEIVVVLVDTLKSFKKKRKLPESYVLLRTEEPDENGDVVRCYLYGNAGLAGWNGHELVDSAEVEFAPTGFVATKLTPAPEFLKTPNVAFVSSLAGLVLVGVLALLALGGRKGYDNSVAKTTDSSGTGIGKSIWTKDSSSSSSSKSSTSSSKSSSSSSSESKPSESSETRVGLTESSTSPSSSTSNRGTRVSNTPAQSYTPPVTNTAPSSRPSTPASSTPSSSSTPQSTTPSSSSQPAESEGETPVAPPTEPSVDTPAVETPVEETPAESPPTEGSSEGESTPPADIP